MNKVQQTDALMQLLELAALNFQDSCTHERVRHLKDDAYHCVSCGSLVYEGEFERV
jgi:hypothetical protein